MINQLASNEILVVGTNMNGHHFGGAAAQAHRDFGLRWECAEGISGQAYAFPTLDHQMGRRTHQALERSRDKLYQAARAHPRYRFLMTAVGTGIAGYQVREMMSLFTDPPANIVLPPEFARQAST